MLLLPTRYYQKTEEKLHKEVAKLRKKLNQGKQDKEKEEAAAERAEAAKASSADTEAEKKARKERRKNSLLGDIDLDEDSGVPIGEQLKQALVRNAGKMMDLFREWDEDGDGEITRKEFRAAMTRMQLEVPQPDVDALFDSWDPSGDGE